LTLDRLSGGVCGAAATDYGVCGDVLHGMHGAIGESSRLMSNIGNPRNESSATDEKGKYANQASSEYPATVICLVDIGQSMAAKLPDGMRRISSTRASVEQLYTAMIGRSVHHGMIDPPPYRVALIFYSELLWDAYRDAGSIIPISTLPDGNRFDLVERGGLPDLAGALRYAKHILAIDLTHWPASWISHAPAPLVLNFTACSEKGAVRSAEPFAQDLKAIRVEDGNLILANFFFSDSLPVPAADPRDWKPYRFGGTTGDPLGDKYLAISSSVSAAYATFLRRHIAPRIRDGDALMFPGQYGALASALLSTLYSEEPSRTSHSQRRLSHD
jgi:hypothetical protein